MASVNVPEQKVPQALFELVRSGDDNIKKMARALIEHFEKEVFFDFQMWKRSGGSDDLIKDITGSDSFENSFTNNESLDRLDNLESIEDLIPVQEETEFNSVAARNNITAVNRDFVDAKNSIIVTMDGNAGWNDQIITRNGDGTPIKVCSTIEIRYKGGRGSDIMLINEGTAIHWHLFIDGQEKYWVAR